MNRAELDQLVAERIARTQEQRSRSRRLIAKGQARYAEEDDARREGFARRMAARDQPVPEGAETTQGDTADFVDAVFLTLGARAARSVAHIVGDEGRTSLGSGFMISPSLFITNNHVLLDEETAATAWIMFNFERGERLAAVEPSVFKLRPDLFFYTVGWKDLDFTVVAVGDRVHGRGSLADQGFCPLSDRPDKHAKGAAVNIVQHPNGWHKKIVLRENRIMGRLDRVLHYEADTEGGSSGSPVFNDAWEVVALHHWGKPFLDTRSVDGQEIPITVNEGVRISRIVEHLRASLPEMADGDKRHLLREALDVTPPSHPQEIRSPEGETSIGSGGERTMENSKTKASASEATLMIPLEVSIRLPGYAVDSPALAPVLRSETPPLPPPDHVSSAASSVRVDTARGPEKVVLDRNYPNRRGYDPGFLPGYKFPLSSIVAPVQGSIAPLKPDEPNHEAGELKYQHFSVIMNADRRFAFLTATNIDGSTYIDIDRETGLPSEIGAEGETWYDDPRMDPSYYVGQSFYSANSTYFDRGHLTRRTDPTWGTPAKAVRANADTFHRTNCTPQHWLFNQSLKFWQGIERHYLEFGATMDRSRMTVLQGPVFGQDDPGYDDLDDQGVFVPRTFWKVIIRVIDGEPRVTGFLASHERLLKRRRTTLRENKEVAPEVDEYLASLQRIERVTGFDMSHLKPHDTFEGQAPDGAEGSGLRVIRSFSALP
ncbi:DNA/RNA non-specific endonuclease [Microvirga sp. VF16]|uniref:DNA/RNA non-specific endonuclease n=1 Tax=Microvirga sp. VF16 TaxID=2807101 RepID=UPI00193D742F|nr:DNA/RNA non-specific endonuclease [Microvirga sp. VF16]QRM32464.1 DNA/RNA non-specific endonuclease [Microvirga sp. VF16]